MNKVTQCAGKILNKTAYHFNKSFTEWKSMFRGSKYIFLHNPRLKGIESTCYSRDKKGTYPYYIIPTEIGLLWAKITYLKVTQKPLAFVYKQIWNRTFKWSTKHWFWSRSCKDVRGQSWRMKKISANAADRRRTGSNPATRQIFFSSSNFDLWYLCSPLTKINV